LFQKQIGLGANRGKRRHVINVIDHAVKFVPGIGTEQHLQSVLSEDIRNDVNSAVAQVRSKDKYVIQQLSSRLEQVEEALAKFILSQLSQSEEQSVTNEGTIPERALKRGGSINLDEERKFVKKAKGLERLEWLLSLHDQHQDTGNLTETTRAFINKAVIPVVKCEKHHNKDKDKFLERWPLETHLLHFARTVVIAKVLYVESIRYDLNKMKFLRSSFHLECE
jgi:hypothetical protein